MNEDTETQLSPLLVCTDWLREEGCVFPHLSPKVLPIDQLTIIQGQTLATDSHCIFPTATQSKQQWSYFIRYKEQKFFTQKGIIFLTHHILSWKNLNLLCNCLISIFFVVVVVFFFFLICLICVDGWTLTNSEPAVKRPEESHRLICTASVLTFSDYRIITVLEPQWLNPLGHLCIILITVYLFYILILMQWGHC